VTELLSIKMTSLKRSKIEAKACSDATIC
jgi:hypothetical protein